VRISEQLGDSVAICKAIGELEAVNRILMPENCQGRGP